MVYKKGEHASEKTEFKKGHSVWKGKKHSGESKIKMRKTKSKAHAENISKGRLNMKFSDTHRKNLSKSHMGKLTGENHWNWKGVTPLNKRLRNSALWKIWRELVFLRDNFTCQNPECEFCNNKMGVMIHPHHIKPLALYPELVFRVNNGITYCAEFHLNSGLHRNIMKEKLSKFKEKKKNCNK